jgi:tetratricopeptide (TPR) repeat protein
LSGQQREALEHAESAIEIAQALKLTKTFVDALALEANLHLYMNRVEEARLDYANAQELAERHNLVELLPSVLGNYANLCLMWDIPGGVEVGQASLEHSRRLGDRYGESVDGANLMAGLLLLGRWPEVSELAPQLLRDEGAPHVQSRMAWLYTLRGDRRAAEEAFGHLSDWTGSGPELRGMRIALAAAMALEQGRSDEALAMGQEMLPSIIEKLGPASEPVRDGWPITLQAALTLGRVEEARELLALLESRPPGHIPPHLEAQLARGRALAGALAGAHEEVEAELHRAIEGLGKLAYPYWLAVTQTDLAEWLVRQGRREEAEPLLSEAGTALTELGARPALERVHTLLRSERSTVQATL